MQEEEDLRRSLASQYEAYRGLAEDFTQYQAVTDLQIEQLTAEAAELKNSLAYERAQADTLSQRLEKTARELQGKNSELAELRAVLSRPMREQPESPRSEPTGLSGISGAHERVISDLCFSQVAHGTAQNEVRILEGELRAERAAARELTRQVEALKAQLDVAATGAAGNMAAEVAGLRATLYKSLTLVAALGCPLDVFSDEVVAEIENYVVGRPGMPGPNTAVERLIDDGLRLLGARPTASEPAPKRLTLRTPAAITGAPGRKDEQLEAAPREEVLERNLHTFRALQIRCEQLEAQNSMLRTENIQGVEEISQLKARLQTQQKANEKLMEMIKKEVATHRQLHEVEIKQNERLRAVASSGQRAAAALRNATLQELSLVVTAARRQDDVLSFINKLKDFTEDNIIKKFHPETLENVIKIDFTDVLETIQQVNIQPVLYDVKSLLAESINAPVPTNYIKQLESFFYQQLDAIVSGKELNDKLHKLLILILLAYTTNSLPEDQQIRRSGLFKSGIDKVAEFSQAFVQLVRQFNVSQEDIQAFYIGKQEEYGSQISNEQTYQTVTEQYITALQQQVEDLQTQLKEFIKDQNIDSDNPGLIPGEVRMRADEGNQSPDNLLKNYSTSDEIRTLIAKASTQNQSGRYVSFLEILVRLTLDHVSSGGKQLFKLAGELSRLTEEQVSQHQLLRRHVSQIGEAVRMAQNRVSALHEECKILAQVTESAQMVQQKLLNQSPEALKQTERYAEDAEKILELMQNSLERFEAVVVQQPSPSASLTGSLAEKYQIQQDKESGDQWRPSVKQISSQLLELQTKMTQFQEYIYQDREKVAQYIDFQKRQERDRVTKLRQSFVLSEQRRERQEKDAALVRQRYAQLSLKYEEAKQNFQKQIQSLQKELQKTREEKVSQLRSNRLELMKNFRAKEEILEEQIRMLRELK